MPTREADAKARIRAIVQRVMVGAFAVALLWPLAPASAGTLGIPLTSNAELAAAALVIAALVAAIPASRLAKVLVALLGVIAILGIAGKAIAISQPPAAFAACYQVNSPRETDASRLGPCEKSYEAPFAADVTRLDSTIDFGFRPGTLDPTGGIRETNWDLSAFNALPYNYLTKAMADQYGYPFEIDQNRLPIAAQWSGVLDGSGPTTLTYVGEGEARAGLRTLPLPASYDAPGQVTFEREPGMALLVDFRWQPSNLSAGPFAAISLTDAGGQPVTALPVALPAAGAPIAPEPSSLALLLPGLITILLLLGLLVLALLIVVALAGARIQRRLTATWLIAGGLLLIGAIASVTQVWQAWWAVPLLPVFVLLLLAEVRLHLDQATSRLIAFLVISTTAIASCAIFTSRSGPLFYRPTGNDFFTYEGQAHTILVSGSLQGGEDIFIYSGAMRYWLYLQHLVFGDGEQGIFVLSIAMLLGATWFAVRRLAVEPLSQPSTQLPLVPRTALLAGLASIVVVALLIGTPFMWQGGFVLLSEYPTWVFLAIAFTLALTRKSAAEEILIGALLGLTILFRGNQLVGIAALLALAWLRLAWPALRARDWSAGGWATARLLAPFLVVGSLGGWHNLVYGGRFVPLATSIPIPVNFPLPPERLLQWGSDPTVAQILSSQLQGVLVLVSPLELMEYGHFRWIIAVIQVSLLAALIAGLVHRFRGAWRWCLLTVLPVTFLLPHVFVQVYVYYPRHVIAGYFIGALVLVALAGRWMRRPPVLDDAQQPAPPVDMKQHA